MRKYVFLILLSCMGCGVREVREELPSVVGVWDNTICNDRIALNEDLTFVWSDDYNHSGSYWLNGNQINFKFSDKIPETYQYTVTTRELTLLKGNQQFEYVKVAHILNVQTGEYTIPSKQKKTVSNLSSCH